MTALESNEYAAFYNNLKQAVVEATQSCHALPSPGDIPYHRSLSRSCAKELDATSDRILTLANALLDNLKETFPGPSNIHSDKGKGKARIIRDEEDVVNPSEFRTRVVDLVDHLLEKTDSHLDDWYGRKTKASDASLSVVERPHSVRSNLSVGGRLPAEILNARHIAKPQNNFRERLSNTRGEVFIPWLRTKPNSSAPLSLDPIHTDDDQESGEAYVPNPYLTELEDIWKRLPVETFAADPQIPQQMASDSFETIPFTFVDTPDLFDEMQANLATASHIAVDIEHHDFRSYHGFVCLVQISIKGHDYILDTLQPHIRSRMQDLNTVFTDPSILKVLHGADKDTQWLQRDFGVYIVGMFDTYEACKILNYPQKSLASLLERFVAFQADKRYQLADWRIRPLPLEMVAYARADTHFLLYVYQSLLSALRQQADSHDAYITSLQTIFERSAKTCSQTYIYPQYASETGLGFGGWRPPIQKWGKQVIYGLPPLPVPFSIQPRVAYKSAAPASLEFYLYRALHDWRDQVARAEDESTRFILSPPMLFRLAERRPVTAGAVLSTLSPISLPIQNRKEELAAYIQDKIDEFEELPDTRPAFQQHNADDATAIGPSDDTAMQSSSEKPSLWTAPPSELRATEGAASMFSQAQKTNVDGINVLRASSSRLFGKKGRHSNKGAADVVFEEILEKVHSSLSLALDFGATMGSPQFEPEPTSFSEPNKVNVGPGSNGAQPDENAADIATAQDILIVGDSAPRRRKKKHAKAVDHPACMPHNASPKKRPHPEVANASESHPIVDILDVEQDDVVQQKSPKKQKKRKEQGDHRTKAPSFGSFPKIKGSKSQTFHS